LVVGWFWVERIEFHWSWIKAISIRHWRVSRWIAGSTVLTWTSSNLFLLSAPVYYGAGAAGVLKASQNMMGAANVWFLGLENVVPVETARRLREGGVHAMLAYTRSILTRWGLLTLCFAGVMAAAPALWLRLIYGPEMVQYAYILRLYALLYLLLFLGGPLRAGLQALEFTVPIFWSYLAMTAFSFAFAIPMAKQLGLSGSMLGLIATQILFQSIVGVSLLIKSRRVAREARLGSHFPTLAE
jgi:O-antigen/teichoic acid export membrane protein